MLFVNGDPFSFVVYIYVVSYRISQCFCDLNRSFCDLNCSPVVFFCLDSCIDLKYQSISFHPLQTSLPLTEPNYQAKIL